MFKMFNWLNPKWIIENFLTMYWIFPDTPAPTDTKVQNTNIPDYAQPYVTNMLEATQRQLYQMDPSGNVTGFNKYKPYSTNMNEYVAGLSPMQQQASQGVAGLQLPGQYNQASGLAGMAGMGSYGAANQASNYGAMGAGYGAQAGQAGNNYFNMATNPNATQAFMNPYLQASLNPQLDEIRRQYGITGTGEMSNATKQGAFGGSREALMASENNRNMNTAMNQTIGQGYNSAFQAAQQAQQFGSNLGLQGQQAAMQGAGLGIQGQQAALQGYGQMNTAANTLGNLGQQQLQGQQNIYNQQNQFGQQQQQIEQNKINQAIQNYANEQQYPMMQLGMMSNMLRGLPMQGMTTQSYTAQPTGLQQFAGALGSASTQPSSSTSVPHKAGGILDVERFDIGGSVKADIAKMPSDKLQSMMQSTPSQIVKGDIQAELALRNTGAAQDFKAGGVLAFTEGDVIPKVLESEESPRQKRERNLNAIKWNSGISEDDPSQQNSNLNAIKWNRPSNGYVPTAEDKAVPTAAQAAATAAAMNGNHEIPKEEVPVPKKDKPKVDPRSILAADNTPAAAAEPAPTYRSLSEDYLKSLSPEAQALMKDLPGAEAKATSVEQAIKDRQAMEEKFIPKELRDARKEDRANLMAQKANIAAEEKRRAEIRENNFWNKLGSTPGPIIATALKGMIEKNEAELVDTEWGRKTLGEVNGLMAKLNDSDYMIAQGHIEKGMSVHEQAVKDLREQFKIIGEHQDRAAQVGMQGYETTERSRTSEADRKSREKVAMAEIGVRREANDIERTKAQNMPTHAETQAERSRDSLSATAQRMFKDDPKAEEKSYDYVMARLTPIEKKLLGYDLTSGPAIPEGVKVSKITK